MSHTQAQLDALKAAYASGVTKMSYDGKTIEYRSMEELKQAIATVEASLSGNAIARPRRVLLSSRRSC